MRSVAGAHVIVTNGVVGTSGFGNHKHNDLLSFDYRIGPRPLIVDPGSYAYTGDPDMRNLLRSTASHNTLRVDGAEQNDFKPEWLFRMFETSRAETVSFSDAADVAEYVGRHHGYERLADPVTHERTLRLSKRSGALDIVDRLSGRGTHDLLWHFHLAPGVAVEPGEHGMRLTAPGLEARLRFDSALHSAIEPAWYSPSYGVRLACAAINLTLRAAVDGERTWAFSVEPVS